jgi:hypothetical protein
VCVGRFLLSTRLSRVARQAKTKHMDALKTFRKNKDTQARPLEARYWVVLLGTGWYSWALGGNLGHWAVRKGYWVVVLLGAFATKWQTHSFVTEWCCDWTAHACADMCSRCMHRWVAHPSEVIYRSEAEAITAFSFTGRQ